MGVSGYPGQEIVRAQGATAFIIGSSGEVKWEPGGESVGLTRDIHFALDGALVASASGAKMLIASGNNPSVAPVNGLTDPTLRLRWSSAAGTTTPVRLPTVSVPDDFDKTVPAILRLYGEGASANANNGVAALVFFGVGGADAGTTAAFTSAPSEKTVSLTTANQTSVGPISVVLSPQAHASGAIDLYAAKLTYKSRARAT